MEVTSSPISRPSFFFLFFFLYVSPLHHLILDPLIYLLVVSIVLFQTISLFVQVTFVAQLQTLFFSMHVAFIIQFQTFF
jgi:hypothetical protein